MTLEHIFETAVAVDLEQCFQQGVKQAQKVGRPVAVSLSLPVERFDPIDLFDQGRLITPDRCFWARPGEAFALVGLGVAHAIDVVEASRFRQAANAWQHLMVGAIREGPRGLPGVGPLLLGGFAFDTQRSATALWAGYPHGRLVLPRLLFTRRNDEAWLTYTAVLNGQSDASALAEVLLTQREQLMGHLRQNGHARSNGHVPSVTVRELRPAADWQTDVANAVQAVRAGEIEKVVLARAVELHSPEAFDAVRALRHLAEHYTGCYIFAIARGERCFLGATPERLVQLRQGEVRTMSLAGSIRRGTTPDEDDQLGQALLDSAKDRNEHAVVVQAMVEALGETCATLQVSESPSLLKLGNIQHLCTTIAGRLANGYTIFDLVERLHPTPAVGGRPREAGLRLIRECEKLDRGWYAGPVGWLDELGEGEFAVAIRSALLHTQTATLFAGCGIVADSDPEREYAESLLKLKPMLAALSHPLLPWL